MASWLSYVASGVLTAGFLQAVVMLLKYRAENRRSDAGTAKDEADAAAILTDASLALLAPLRAELDRVNAKLAETEQRVDTLLKHVNEQQAELDRYRLAYGHL